VVINVFIRWPFGIWIWNQAGVRVLFTIDDGLSGYAVALIVAFKKQTAMLQVNQEKTNVSGIFQECLVVPI